MNSSGSPAVASPTSKTRAGAVHEWGRARPDMKVVPLAADSLGVRSMATYVECGQTRVVIDPGASLGQRRFNLPPADEEWEALRRANDRIGAYATRAGVIFISHYHEDHFR